MIYDHSNPLLTHHSNQLLTHSLTISKKIESPRRSLRSLWGLINTIFAGSVYQTEQLAINVLHSLTAMHWENNEKQCTVQKFTLGFLSFYLLIAKFKHGLKLEY